MKCKSLFVKNAPILGTIRRISKILFVFDRVIIEEGAKLFWKQLQKRAKLLNNL